MRRGRPVSQQASPPPSSKCSLIGQSDFWEREFTLALDRTHKTLPVASRNRRVFQNRSRERITLTCKIHPKSRAPGSKPNGRRRRSCRPGQEAINKRGQQAASRKVRHQNNGTTARARFTSPASAAGFIVRALNEPGRGPGVEMYGRAGYIK